MKVDMAMKRATWLVVAFALGLVIADITALTAQDRWRKNTPVKARVWKIKKHRKGGGR